MPILVQFGLEDLVQTRSKTCVPNEAESVLSSFNFVNRRPHLTVSPYLEKYKDNGIALPDPRLLALHAVCARVAHISGAAEYFDDMTWDAEETQILANDGSTALLLADLLAPYTNSIE